MHLPVNAKTAPIKRTLECKRITRQEADFMTQKAALSSLTLASTNG
jgi:hypothetical protein